MSKELLMLPIDCLLVEILVRIEKKIVLFESSNKMTKYQHNDELVHVEFEPS